MKQNNTWRKGYDRDPECLWQGGHWTDRATGLCIRCQREALKEAAHPKHWSQPNSGSGHE